MVSLVFQGFIKNKLESALPLIVIVKFRFSTSMPYEFEMGGLGVLFSIPRPYTSWCFSVLFVLTTR